MFSEIEIAGLVAFGVAIISFSIDLLIKFEFESFTISKFLLELSHLILLVEFFLLKFSLSSLMILFILLLLLLYKIFLGLILLLNKLLFFSFWKLSNNLVLLLLLLLLKVLDFLISFWLSYF